MTNAATLSTDRSSSFRMGEALLVLAVAAALLWLVARFAPLEWPTADTEIVLDGAHYRAGPEEIRWLESFTALHFDAGEQAARALVGEAMDTRLDALFDEAEANLPLFLDWYYSLSGEYSRLAMAALEAVDLADASFVAGRAASMLLPEESWTVHLAALEAEAAERLGAHHESLRDGWRAAVGERLSAHRVPAPITADRHRPVIVLDDLLGGLVAQELGALGTRVSVSTGAAAIGAAAAPALARAAAVRGGRAAASRAAARGASRIGAAAAGSATVCAPDEPAAAACAVLGGAGAWLATDWALLRIDERVHRAELERSFRETLTGLRAEIERELTAAFDASLEAHYAAAEGEIRRTFIPARAARAREAPE